VCKKGGDGIPLGGNALEVRTAVRDGQEKDSVEEGLCRGGSQLIGRGEKKMTEEGVKGHAL